jgi:exodeoxyribonuclease VII large subunit
MLRLLTVTELNSFLRELIDAEGLLNDLWIEGEVFDFRQPSSGHWYFKLRHGEATIPAVSWRSAVSRIGMRPENGAAVLAHGRVGFYETSGTLQLYIDDLRPSGTGLLHAEFERLRTQLEAEGLFDPARKRALPIFPQRIGIATSASGAALQDILNILRRRFPLAEVLIAPCRVQGEGAVESIVEALYALYQQPPDVIILARGGGSTDDLWVFNNETVARAVFASPVPLVTGVGHETDTTIVDYVADLRAPTPSAAAELITPDQLALRAELAIYRDRLSTVVAEQIAGERQNLQQLQRQIAQQNPVHRINRQRQALDELTRRATTRLEHQIILHRAWLAGVEQKLASLSPLATLQRGYAVVRKTDGTVITKPEQLTQSERFDVIVAGGTFEGERT